MTAGAIGRVELEPPTSLAKDGAGKEGAAPPGPSNRAGVLRGISGFTSRGIVQLLLLGVTIVATRKLSIADFGAYALGSLFLVLARQLFYIGPYEYMLMEREERGLLPACLLANMVQATWLAVVLGLLWLTAPLLFRSAEVGTILGMLVPSVFLVAATAWYEAVLLRAMRVRRYYASTLVGDTVGAAVAVLLLLRGHGVASLVMQTYVRLGVLMVLYALATRERPGLGCSWRQAWVGAMPVLRWSRARHAAVLLNFATSNGADLVLGLLLSPSATGLYRAANRIVAALTELFAQPLQKIAQTNLSASWVRDRDMGTSWLTMLSGVGAIAWAALMTLAVLAQDLLPLVLGDKWAPAVPIVVVFCVVKAFSLLDAVTTSFLVCHDRQRSMLKVQAIAAVCVTVLGVSATPWGPAAVAIAVGVAASGMSMVYGAMVMRLSGADRSAINALLWTAAPPVAAVAMGLTMFRAATPQLHGFHAVVGGGAVATVACLAGMLCVRHRMLSAIGSLGHLPAPAGLR